MQYPPLAGAIATSLMDQAAGSFCLLFLQLCVDLDELHNLLSIGLTRASAVSL